MLIANAVLTITSIPGGPVVSMSLRLPSPAEGIGSITFTSHEGGAQTVPLPQPVASQIAAALAEVIPPVR